MSTYGGWSNYETWLANAWIYKDTISQKYWRERTKYWLNTPELGRVQGFANDLDGIHYNELPEEDGFVSDLLEYAFTQVNWDEIAEALLSKY